MWPVTPAVRVDLSHPGSFARILAELKPGLVVHAACLSQAAACEQQPEYAKRVNVEAVVEMLDCTSDYGGHVVYISTEQVFDGRQEVYRETDAPCPLSNYGRTKAQAEELVLQAGGAVVRLPLLLGPSLDNGRAGADGGMIRSLREGRKLSLFTDELRAPVHVDWVAPMLWRIGAERLQGVFHLGGEEVLSRHELGLRALDMSGMEADLEASLARDFDGPARSLRLVLDSRRARKELGWEPPNLRQSLTRTFGPSPDQGPQ